jgi:hypothetical protein
MQAAVNFLCSMKEAQRAHENHLSRWDHGYAQPLFNAGKNYNPEAIRTTWVLVENFLTLHCCAACSISSTTLRQIINKLSEGYASFGKRTACQGTTSAIRNAIHN